MHRHNGCDGITVNQNRLIMKGGGASEYINMGNCVHGHSSQQASISENGAVKTLLGAKLEPDRSTYFLFKIKLVHLAPNVNRGRQMLVSVNAT
ncbi:hypothetical protein GCM10007086_05930 [Photobacterium aphoticum]|nr:hypothetical protein GCM10007086_05930 [Photobacterium aphoticum]